MANAQTVDMGMLAKFFGQANVGTHERLPNAHIVDGSIKAILGGTDITQKRKLAEMLKRADVEGSDSWPVREIKDRYHTKETLIQIYHGYEVEKYLV